MDKSINIDKKLYDSINVVALYNKNEQIMVIGGQTIGNDIMIDRLSLKWFTENDLISHDNESASINESLLLSSIYNLGCDGYDTVFMIHTHPCETLLDDYFYGSLSEDDLKNSKKLYLWCKKHNMRYIDGISTGKDIYFWSIDNKDNYPKQLDCYVNGVLLHNKIPAFDSIINNFKHFK